MSYATSITRLKATVKVIEEWVKMATSATDNFATVAAALIADTSVIGINGAQLQLAALSGLEAVLTEIKSQGRALLMPVFAQIARDIDSDTVDGDTITDLTQFFIDLRYYEESTADDKVTARAVTYASEPAGSAAGYVKRLTVGPDGADAKIESGRHNFTLTAKVTNKPASFQAISTFMGTEGPKDGLDYRTAPGARGNVDITHVNDIDTGNAVSNPTMRGNSDITDEAALTAATDWTLATGAGSPTPKIETTTVWRGMAYVLSMATASTTKTFTQTIPSGVLNDRYQPYLPFVPMYLNAGATGTFTITWGSKSQAFTEADLSAGAWIPLIVDRDADLYPLNFDTNGATWALSIAMGAGAGTNEVLWAGFFAAKMQQYEDVWYAIISDHTQPALGATRTFADSATAMGGIIQDVLGFVFDDEHVGAYMNTAGTNAIADPA